MAVKAGYLASVTLGTSTIVAMGTWSLSGITADQMESSSFGDKLEDI